MLPKCKIDVRIIFEKIRSERLKTRSKWRFFEGARQARARMYTTCKVEFSAMKNIGTSLGMNGYICEIQTASILILLIKTKTLIRVKLVKKQKKA